MQDHDPSSLLVGGVLPTGRTARCRGEMGLKEKYRFFLSFFFGVYKSGSGYEPSSLKDTFYHHHGIFAGFDQQLSS